MEKFIFVVVALDLSDARGAIAAFTTPEAADAFVISCCTTDDNDALGIAKMGEGSWKDCTLEVEKVPLF